ncbi:1-phosphofructokinase [Anaerolineales bacterium]|nr:1-phosphofructokinase [Anaerolineales bacterium]
MILCLTPNPAIDRTMYLDVLYIGEVHRTNKVLAAAGGKGLNVARAIRTLGGDPLCMGFLGGHAGNLLSELAEQEGLHGYWTRTKNETRTCIILVQPNRDATVINDPGAAVDLDECKSLVFDVWEKSFEASRVCVSGSLPPGFSLDLFKSMLAGLVERKKSVWVDTSSQALKTALSVRGVNIKVNAAELSEALGVEISNTEQAVNAAWELCQSGIEWAVVTLGKQGAVLVSADESWVAQPPEIQIVSSVGSGDAFLGGLAFAFSKGYTPDLALRHAVAAGAANALCAGGGVLSLADFGKLYENCVCTEGIS